MIDQNFKTNQHTEKNLQKCLVDFPPEVLLKIFDFVPNKAELKLTCMKFYEILNEKETKKLRLVIKDDNINEYKVILRSAKHYDDVELRLWNYDDFSMHRLSQIFLKFRKSLKKISFKFAALDEKYLLKLLNMLPGLENITIDVSLINPVPASHKLEMLRNVNFTCKVEAANILFEIPPDVVRKLSFTSVFKDVIPSEELLRKIFERQRNIEELNINPEKISSPLNLLKLKKLRLASSSNCKVILRNQYSLISLEILEAVYSQEFETICEMVELKSLAIDLGFVNSGSIRNLANLQNLQELRITTNRPCHLKALSQIDSFPCLKKLELNFLFRENFPVFFENISTIFPSLVDLKVSSVDVEVLEILLNIQSLRSLDICAVLKENFETKLPPVTNENLRELKIWHDLHSSFIIDITKSLINLKKLYLVDGANDLTALKMILTSCKKLTHIATKNQKTASSPFSQLMILFRDHGLKLTYFEYNHVKFACDIEKFKQIFGVHFQFIHGENGNKSLIMRNEKWK